MNLTAQSITSDDTIRLPFGTGRTSPVAAEDVAEVIAMILANPAAHVGKIDKLTGPKSEDMTGIAMEYSTALGRKIIYQEVPLEAWRASELRSLKLPQHFLTMARLHAANRYDRLTYDVETIRGRPATTVREFVAKHAELFASNRQP